MVTSLPLPEIAAAAIRLIRTLKDSNISAKLFGSCAMWHIAERSRPLLFSAGRFPEDIDLVVRHSDLPTLLSFLKRAGWIEDEWLRANSGGSRARFSQPNLSMPILDVWVGKLRMAQTLDIEESMDLCEVSLPITDLVLSKLQIHHLTSKDALDLLALLNAFEFSGDPCRRLDSERISSIVYNSWGWYHSIEQSAREFVQFSQQMKSQSTIDELQSANISKVLDSILDVSASTPKTVLWYLRRLIGHKIQWYATFEAL
jgi:hypothetical protein